MSAAEKRSVQSSNNVTSPYRLWILISAIGFTVMALMVSVAKNINKTRALVCYYEEKAYPILKMAALCRPKYKLQ